MTERRIGNEGGQDIRSLSRQKSMAHKDEFILKKAFEKQSFISGFARAQFLRQLIEVKTIMKRAKIMRR